MNRIFFSLLIVGSTACRDVTPPLDQALALAVTATGNPFVGSWENTDPLDGSHQHMTVGGGPNLPVHLRDDGATACINAGLGFVPATLDGFAVITGPSTFELTADVYCYPPGPNGRQLIIENVTLPFTYDPERDILFTEAGVDCWYRSGNPERCPSVTATGNPFVGSWENTDPLDGSHQHMTVGGGPNLPVHLRDDGATACINAGLGFVPATLDGFAVITGPSTFELTADVYCYPPGPNGRQLIIENVTLPFTYDPERDILFTQAGVDCWYRSGNPERCP